MLAFNVRSENFFLLLFFLVLVVNFLVFWKKRDRNREITSDARCYPETLAKKTFNYANIIHQIVVKCILLGQKFRLNILYCSPTLNTLYWFQRPMQSNEKTTTRKIVIIWHATINSIPFVVCFFFNFFFAFYFFKFQIKELVF